LDTRTADGVDDDDGVVSGEEAVLDFFDSRSREEKENDDDSPDSPTRTDRFEADRTDLEEEFSATLSNFGLLFPLKG